MMDFLAGLGYGLKGGTQGYQQGSNLAMMSQLQNLLGQQDNGVNFTGSTPYDQATAVDDASTLASDGTNNTQTQQGDKLLRMLVMNQLMNGMRKF